MRRDVLQRHRALAGHRYLAEGRVCRHRLIEKKTVVLHTVYTISIIIIGIVVFYLTEVELQKCTFEL
jgi:hypothetical protein